MPMQYEFPLTENFTTTDRYKVFYCKTQENSVLLTIAATYVGEDQSGDITIIGTLPSGFRPDHVVYSATVISNTSKNNVAIGNVAVETYGTVALHFYGGLSEGASVFTSFVFTADTVSQTPQTQLA